MENFQLLVNSDVLKHTTFHVKPWLEAFENPQRIQYTLDYLRNVSMLGYVIKTVKRSATSIDLMKVHSPFLIELIIELNDIGTGEIGENAFASENLLKSILAAVGTAFEAVDRVMQNKTRHAFAMIRPPGHHASYSNAMGLCFVNNMALTVNYLNEKYNLGRIAIIDIDDHFGNGTSEMFYTDPDVLYISLHEYDLSAPWAGGIDEIGFGAGEGTNINIPLAEQSNGDDYIKAIDSIVLPILKRFDPEIVLVSAGFDGHYLDPVGNLCLTSQTYYEFAKRINEFVKSIKYKKTIWLLEGGYNPFAMGCSIEAIITALENKRYKPLPDLFSSIPKKYQKTQHNNRVLFELKDLHNLT